MRFIIILSVFPLLINTSFAQRNRGVWKVWTDIEKCKTVIVQNNFTLSNETISCVLKDTLKISKLSNNTIRKNIVLINILKSYYSCVMEEYNENNCFLFLEEAKRYYNNLSKNKYYKKNIDSLYFSDLKYFFIRIKENKKNEHGLSLLINIESKIKNSKNYNEIYNLIREANNLANKYNLNSEFEKIKEIAKIKKKEIGLEILENLKIEINTINNTINIDNMKKINEYKEIINNVKIEYDLNIEALKLLELLKLEKDKICLSITNNIKEEINKNMNHEELITLIKKIENIDKNCDYNDNILSILQNMDIKLRQIEKAISIENICEPTDSYDITDKFKKCVNMHCIVGGIEIALDKLGYSKYNTYNTIPIRNGYAIVTAIEEITKDGYTVYIHNPNRFIFTDRVNFEDDNRSYLEAFFCGRYKIFRFFIFLITIDNNNNDKVLCNNLVYRKKTIFDICKQNYEINELDRRISNRVVKCYTYDYIACDSYKYLSKDLSNVKINNTITHLQNSEILEILSR